MKTYCRQILLCVERRICVLVIIHFGLFSPIALNAQAFVAGSLKETNASRDTIYLLSLDNLRQRPIYVLTEPQYVMDASVRVSPKGNLVALLPVVSSFLQDDEGVYYQDRKLVVIDTAGRKFYESMDIQKFTWSPDGKSIACITGIDVEGFGFRADKLIVINTDNWSQRVLQEGIVYQDIFWAEFDSMIYTTDFQYVYKTNPRTGKVEKTNYKGIHFSPDGKYYFVANYEGGTFAVYERQTNKNVTPEGFEGNPAVNFHRWLPEGSTLVFGDVFREKQVYDVATRTIRKKILGQLLGYNNETKEFIVLKHHRYFPEVPDKKVERIADGR